MHTIWKHKMGVFVSSFGLLFLHFLVLSLCVHSSAISSNSETDRLALLEFKSGIKGDPFSVMASWNSSIHVCRWNGVTCGRRHQRVTVLDLSSYKLAGSVSPHVGNLSFLKNLTLENNSFTGQIPPELGRLHRLRFLTLGTNFLVGGIPANLSRCLNLVGLNLSHNELSGRIPAEIGSLTSLQVLSFSQNNLTGNIPFSIGNLSSLQKLLFLSNQLSGRIPYSLGQLTNLTAFGLADNNLEGTIPRAIFNLSSIDIFGVYQNQLHGSLPSQLGTLLPNLQYFGIFQNRFTGSIPSSLSNASKVQKIFLDANSFSGQVPNLEDLHELEWFNIEHNNLGSGGEGDLRFMCTLANATNFDWLYTSYNNLGGAFPHCVANLSLRALQIGNNQIGGTLPSGIGNMKLLENLSIWGNRFSGSIPEDIGELQSLSLLDLSINGFTRNIPASIGNLSKLTILQLYSNKLQGTIPSSLGNYQYLSYFDISDNNISGIIPSTLFNISSLSLGFKLSWNKLTGSLPAEVQNLASLGDFDVSQNMLSGVIPSSFGSCVMLEYLSLQDNFFHGSIPSSFASLRSLQYLNLSHNNLSGLIPIFLESIHFQALDLSFNNFSGLLPTGGIFKNASAVSVEGNQMLCAASQDLHLPICPSGEPKKTKVSLKIIISVLLSSVVVSVIFVIWLSKKKSKEGAVPGSSENELLQVSYQTLFTATEGFSPTNLIGEGSFGSVYKGILDPQRIVAVKVFNLQRRGACRSFRVECEALRNIRHRNLVKVITVCSSIDFRGDDFKALVYEYMAHGNLDQWLHPAEATIKLSLLQRLNIAIDTASALDYLHRHYGRTPIVHCDLKPTNVLLNDEMTAQVGDFGLMKFLSECTNSSSTIQTSTTGVRGTIGYVAPEYGTGGEVSTYGDMYSYGILLLEMFTGKRPTDEMFNDDNNTNLHSYVKMGLPDRVAEVADPALVQEALGSNERYQEVMESLILVFDIGIACSRESPRERMNISDALAGLILVRDKEQQIIRRRRAY